MKIPNAGNAVIAEDKLRNYLLNLAHRRGGPKAKLLLGMGYRADDWQRLEADIRAQHLTAEITGETDTDYGKRYEVVAPLQGPTGQVIAFCSVLEELKKFTLGRVRVLLH